MLNTLQNSFLLGGLVLAMGACVGIAANHLWTFVRAVRSSTKRMTDFGVEKTTFAKLGFARRSLDTDLIAGIGTHRAAEQSLGTTVMRASIGIKVISILLLPFICWVLYFDPSGISLAGVPFLREAIVAMAVYAIIFTFSYTVRYDREEIVATGALIFRKTRRWKDLVSIKDAGNYTLIVRFADGRKLNIQKYLVGIRDFINLAKEHAETNKRRL